MKTAIVLLGGVVILLLFLLILQIRELKSITSQVKRLGGENTNELVHSIGSGKITAKLIDEINNILKEIHRTRVDYARKSHNLEQMMTNISHDLRTPLTSAMGYMELLQNPELPEEEAQKEMAIVRQRLNRLEELLDSFFEFFTIISGDKQPEKEKLNLVSVLEESIAHFYDDYSRQNRRISFLCDRRKVEISSNYHMLMRIFDNLISNAYKHGEGDLEIKVLTSDKITICFENPLADSEVDINCIFDEFYTTDISRTRGNTGLGLAIAKQFTRMLGGDIFAGYEAGIFSITVNVNEC
jgi:signal transduction histidine kinase